MPDVIVEKNTIVDLYSLPDFTVGDVLSVQNKNRNYSAYLTSDATVPDDAFAGDEIAYLGTAKTTATTQNAWVSAPRDNIILSVKAE